MREIIEQGPSKKRSIWNSLREKLKHRNTPKDVRIVLWQGVATYSISMIVSIVIWAHSAEGALLLLFQAINQCLLATNVTFAMGVLLQILFEMKDVTVRNISHIIILVVVIPAYLALFLGLETLLGYSRYDILREFITLIVQHVGTLTILWLSCKAMEEIHQGRKARKRRQNRRSISA